MMRLQNKHEMSAAVEERDDNPGFRWLFYGVTIQA